MIDIVLVAVGTLLVVGIIVYLIVKSSSKIKKNGSDPYGGQTDEAIKQIFNEQFREELRNRGRLHFEKIIGENAMFLQQDLRLTTSQLNEYLKSEITKKLEEEFAKYEQSITDAKQLAIESIKKTQDLIEEQREELGKEVREQLSKDKQIVLNRFEENMTEIVNHYLVDAIGNQVDLTDQLEYILSELQANKQAIIGDIKDGA